jgi:mannitol/fructose-specific phosphotransferase system IIA component (Ntr-type)
MKNYPKVSESFNISAKVCFFFFLPKKTSSDNKQITVITKLTAYLNPKLILKILNIINQTQDKADKPQAKNENKILS